MKNIKTIIFIALALLGIVAAAFLVKKSTEVRKGAYAGQVGLMLTTGNATEANVLKLCKDNSGNYSGKFFVLLNPNNYSIPGAALKFAFDKTKITIDNVSFHSKYGASIWNSDKANSEGVLKITALSLEKVLPLTPFNLAEVTVHSLNTGESELSLIASNASDYQIVFESTNAGGDNTLGILQAALVKIRIRTDECAASTSTPTKPATVTATRTPTKIPTSTPTKPPATATNTKTPTPIINASPTPTGANDNTLEINNPEAVRVQIQTDECVAVTPTNTPIHITMAPTETPIQCLHGVCKDEMCIQVPGCVDSECFNDKDCVLPPEPTKTPTPTPAEQILKCNDLCSTVINNICPEVNGIKTYCTRTNDNNDYQCRNLQCAEEEDCICPPEPTETLTPGASQINFKISFGGVNHQIPTQHVKVRVIKDSFEREFEDVDVSFDENGIGSGTVSLTNIPASYGFFIFIKGPKHLARKFCEDGQTERCSSGAEGLIINQEQNNFDFSGLPILPGDYNQDAGEKIGKANSVDFAILVNELDSTGDNLKSDVNYNNKVEGGDVALFLHTLSEVYEEDN